VFTRLRHAYSNRPFPFHAAVLLLTCFAVFSNTYGHEFQLDSEEGLVDNSYIRSLDQIPRLFSDPLTLTTNQANVDYRPILMTTYALNYWMSGYEMWSWHLVQILLHFACVLGLYGLCRNLMSRFHAGEGSDAIAHIGLISALIFAVHPVTSGVVNYVWARSTLLTVALLFPCLLLAMRRRPSRGSNLLSWVLYALALFTKIEALAVLGVLCLVEVLRAASRRMETTSSNPGTSSSLVIRDLRASLNRQTLFKLLPFAVITVVYLAIRLPLIPDYAVQSRAANNVTHLEYLLTQTTAWWTYVLHWFLPINLVADHANYPIARSLMEPRVMMAVGGWIAVGVLTLRLYRRYPYVPLLTIAALMLISPTSSFIPLAEMVNEHRPYMPMAILSLTWMIPLSLAARHAVAHSRIPASSVPLFVVVLLASLATVTWHRNTAFSTTESYWGDIQAKAPSMRSQVNYGRLMLSNGEMDAARECFEASLESSPNWHVTHANLGVLFDRTGDDAMALKHFDLAVAYEVHTGDSLYYRGRFHLSRQRYSSAYADFQDCLLKSREAYRVLVGLATACAGLGRGDECLETTRRCLEDEPEKTEFEIVEISRPFWGAPDRYRAGLRYFQALAEDLPGRWWIHTNIASLAGLLGEGDVAATASRRAEELR
jgi:tetratricopeptide (TPR) repeat protein